MTDIELFKTSPLPAGFVCTPTPEALAQRQTLLDVAETITRCTTPEENEMIAQCGSAMQKMVKSAKKDGLEIRRPLNAIADIIKRTEDSFLAPLIPHMARIGQFATAFRMEQERKAEAERQARAAEIVRLQEQARKAAEDARKKEEAGDLAGALMGELAAQAAGMATTTAISVPEPEATKTAGQSFKPKELGWECTDPIALWNARPELCEPPMPKASAIRSVCVPEIPVPGLKLWWESRITFKRR